MTHKMKNNTTLPELHDNSLFIERGCIGGKWIVGSNRKTFNVTDPATEAVIGTCPEFSTEDTIEAIHAAATAFKSFQRTTPRERSRLLRRWYDLVLRNQDDLSTLISLENGKAHSDAISEVVYAASFLEWFSEEAPRIYGDAIPATIPANQVITIKEPVGVCALVTPWNFPAAMITRKAGAALAAGCTVVIKSPAETPFTVNAVVELAHRAGIPPGVINVCTGLDATIDVVHALTSSPLVHKLSFTGSTSVGKILMRQCAETTLKKVTLELGGNAPFIVFDDADIDAAVNGAVVSKFRSCGQVCVSANRIYVHNDVYDSFATKLAARVRDEFILGPAFAPNVTHGPLIHGRAVEKVEEHIGDAVAKGAHVIIGGGRRQDLGPNFFEPTVVTECNSNMKLASDETFGPLAGLFRFNSEPEVLELANHTEMGLAAYFFSRDVQRVWRVARALQVGMVGINTGLISDAASPFGGIKCSGFGREGGKYGIEEYMTTKTITLGGAVQHLQSRL